MSIQFVYIFFVLTLSFEQPEYTEDSSQSPTTSTPSVQSQKPKSSHSKNKKKRQRRQERKGLGTQESVTQSPTTSSNEKLVEIPSQELKKEKDETKETEETEEKTQELLPEKDPSTYKYVEKPFAKDIIILPNYEMCKGYKKYTTQLKYMQFVVFWPGEKCEDSTCSLPVKTEIVKEGFFLHGFWPQFYTQKHLQCCHTKYGIRDIEKMIKSDDFLFTKIVNNWMSIKSCIFSIYQYDKHGSCSLTTYNSENGPKDYLNTAINLYEKVDIWKILQESDLKVETEKMYNTEDLRKVIYPIFNVNPVFSCKEIGSLFEIKICFDIDIDKYDPKPRECPDRVIQTEKRKCGDMVKLKKFPDYLLNPLTAPRNNCEF
ncbi:ribonuclease S-7 precursor, putative [Entamoeba invadens IP1]|uniref:Ribonuclease S-7, putative n=1 Tax=Entamoeba invadens IP1 TaxID=370355 RepID=L7FN00_ENTIV|nr:ribonuclease S-7 precursor, putative [Entamoeba invadens IP1]ELP90975.1 ribonuclease S-7 precursor, putative [Entamoeba invadens IP1]|eukprot:XP_004257746.1 ribonuclease S-7 precursor, putative [Entamoeba invadens IP1]